MITDTQVEAYRRDGFIVVADLVAPETLSALRQIIAELVAGAAAVETHNAIYDLWLRFRRLGCRGRNWRSCSQDQHEPESNSAAH